VTQVHLSPAAHRLHWAYVVPGSNVEACLLLDTTHNIATPEGVELKLPVAGLPARTLAWLIDAIIKIVAISLAGIVTALLGAAGTGLHLIALFALLWLYNVLFEVFNRGATPGKRALGLRVMNTNGTPVGWAGSTIRNLVRAVDLLPGCYLLGFLSVYLSERYQRLGDLAAGTIVIYSLNDHAVPPANDIEPLPIHVPLTAAEQQAIVSFAERAPRINPERLAELAALLEPVLGPVDAEQLRRHAAWIAGAGR
jgi:uncharacterized RDD family membrane protein YckC